MDCGTESCLVEVLHFHNMIVFVVMYDAVRNLKHNNASININTRIQQDQDLIIIIIVFLCKAQYIP